MSAIRRRETQSDLMHLREVPPAGTSRSSREEGQAIVELVMILPIFLGLIFLAIGYGITLNNYLRVGDVAQAGARAASVARFNGQAPCASGSLSGDALAAATAEAAGLGLIQPPSCECFDPSGAPVAQCQAGDQIKVTATVQSQNAMTTIPFISAALPDKLTGNATVLLQ